MNLKEWIYSCIGYILQRIRHKIPPKVSLDDYGHFVDFNREGDIYYNFLLKK
jgi:hypothetical protein